MVNIIRFGSELCGEVLLDIEVVLWICIRQILVVRVLGDIKLVRHERTHTAKLQDALTAVEDGKLVYRCKIPSILSSDEFRFRQKNTPFIRDLSPKQRGYVFILRSRPRSCNGS